MGICNELEKIILKCQVLKEKYGFNYEIKTTKKRNNFSKDIISKKLIEKCDDKTFAKELCIKNDLEYER